MLVFTLDIELIESYLVFITVIVTAFHYVQPPEICNTTEYDLKLLHKGSCDNYALFDRYGICYEQSHCVLKVLSRSKKIWIRRQGRKSRRR